MVNNRWIFINLNLRGTKKKKYGKIANDTFRALRFYIFLKWDSGSLFRCIS